MPLNKEVACYKIVISQKRRALVELGTPATYRAPVIENSSRGVYYLEYITGLGFQKEYIFVEYCHTSICRV